MSNIKDILAQNDDLAFSNVGLSIEKLRIQVQNSIFESAIESAIMALEAGCDTRFVTEGLKSALSSQYSPNNWKLMESA